VSMVSVMRCMRQRGGVWRLGVAACVAGCQPASRNGPAALLSDAAPLHDAVQQVTDVIVYDIFSPPQAARVYAYGSVAAYEVLRHGDSTLRTMAGQLTALQALPAPDSGVSLPLAGVRAYLSVSKALTFSQARVDSVRAAMTVQLSAGLSGDAAARSVAYGDTIAARVLAWAGGDKYKESRSFPKFTVSKDPARWEPTPPAYMDAVEPNWGIIRPFVLDSASQFRPAAPYAFDTTASSPFFRQAREVLETGKQLSEEQRAIAAFWDCNPYVMNVQGHTMFALKKISPGGHWMGIVKIVAAQRRAAMPVAAEAYARTAVALADGFLSAWDEKYRSAVIRPETVINRYLDPAWTPLLQTPPFPEYTSGHSVISNAAAAVLTDQFGDSVAFTDSTEVAYRLPVRSFRSFAHAASEAAISRLYGGIHYRQAIDEGSAQGKRVGAHHVARLHTRAVVAVATADSAAVGARMARR
jgi:hypothetical protein